MYYVGKVKYIKDLGDGKYKKVTEEVVIESKSGIIKEAMILLEVYCAQNIKGDFTIKGVNDSTISEVHTTGTCGVFHMVTVNYESVDEDSGKEKIFTNKILFESETTKEAEDMTHELMEDSLVQYSITDVSLKKNIGDCIIGQSATDEVSKLQEFMNHASGLWATAKPEFIPVEHRGEFHKLQY